MEKPEGIDLDLADGISVGYLEQMNASQVHPATALFAAIKIVAILSVNCGVTDALAVKQLREVLKHTRERFKGFTP
jgi:hypothetical protein